METVPYKQGWSAGYRGRPFGVPASEWSGALNPFPCGSRQAVEWQRGHDAGRKQGRDDLLEKRILFAKGQ